MRTVVLSKTTDKRYQCLKPGCSPSTTVFASNLRNCRLACLANTQYRTLNFQQSSNQCNLFANIPTQYDDILAQTGVVTMTAIDNRELSAPCNIMFSNMTTYSTGTGPMSVAVADINNDNKLDLVVTNKDMNNIGVLLNAGNGTFLVQIIISNSSQPWPLATIDVNNDNKPDIIVTNQNSNNVGVLLNTGNGTFLSQTTYPIGSGAGPRSFAVVDVNNDNKPDIIVTLYCSNNIGVLLNMGNGTFLSQTTYSTSSRSGPRSVAVGDVNNDSKPDIVVVNQGLNNVGVFLNAGNGTFLNQTFFSVGSYPRGVVLIDVNNDNKPDIIDTNQNSNNVGVVLNTGNGTFFNQTTFATGSQPVLFSVVDVNNDS